MTTCVACKQYQDGDYFWMRMKNIFQIEMCRKCADRHAEGFIKYYEVIEAAKKVQEAGGLFITDRENIFII